MSEDELLDKDLLNVLHSRKGYQSLDGMATYWDCGSLYVAQKSYIARVGRKKDFFHILYGLRRWLRDNALFLVTLAAAILFSWAVAGT